MIVYSVVDNPVSMNFVGLDNFVKLMQDVVILDEEAAWQLFGSSDVVIVENQNRFDIENLVEIWQDFGTRSMGLSGVVFPYWENMARGYEDILAGLFFIQILLLSFVLIVAVVALWRTWLHRRWRARDVVGKVGDFLYEGGARRQQRKNEKLGIEENPFVLLTFEDDLYDDVTDDIL